MKYGYSLPKRIDIINKFHESASSETSRLEFRGVIEVFKMGKVSIEMPRYRLNNGRTQASQLEYLANNSELSSDFFSRDLELLSAQQAQHQILKGMINDAGLLNELKKNRQREPLILCNKGFVVNGNRRLCAMRELYESDPESFSYFSHVDVIVLPACEEKDIDELEANLQVKQDTKAEYSWITLAIMLKTRRESYGYTDRELARLYPDLSEKGVKLYLSMLAEVDKYLNHRGDSRKYHIVENSKHAFEKIVNGRSKLGEEGKKDIFEKISYCLLENTDKVGGRLYSAIPDVNDYLDSVISYLKEELPLEDYNNEGQGNSEIDNLFGDVNTEYLSLSKAIDDEANKEIVLEAVKEVIEDEKSKKKNQHNSLSSLRHLIRANTNINEAINSLNENSNATGLQEQLDAIISSVDTIKTWLSKNA